MSGKPHGERIATSSGHVFCGMPAYSGDYRIREPYEGGDISAASMSANLPTAAFDIADSIAFFDGYMYSPCYRGAPAGIQLFEHCKRPPPLLASCFHGE